MNKALSPTQKITFSAMLLALAVVSTFVAKTIPMGMFYFLRFSLTPALVIYTSLALGPLYGAIVGACADLIPAFTYSQGEYNFLITFVYIILGILPWALEKITRRFRSALRKPYFFYAALAVIFVAVALIFYLTDWIDYSFGAASSWGKPTVLALSAVLDVGLCVGLYFTNRYYQKRILEQSDIPSPNEIATIALVSELLVMNLLKALAFWAWYKFLGSGGAVPFPLHYGFFFSMLLLGLPLDVLIITFANSWLLLYTKRFIRSYGYEEPATPSVSEKASSSVLVDDENHLENDSEDKKRAITNQKKARIGWTIFFTVVILIMVICIVVIKVMQAHPTPSSSTSQIRNLFVFLHF
jgi:hypothetical protein